MPRPQGLPKTGGRKKGSLNKRSSMLNEHLENLNFDVVEELVKCVNDPGYHEMKPHILMKLLEFLYPKYRQQNPKDSANSSTPPEVTFIYEEVS